MTADAAPQPLVLADTAVAIMCMPCQRTCGYFTPTADLVLADLTGREDCHPIHPFAAWCREPALRSRLAGRASRILVLFDDLAVTRSWMLPPNPPDLDDLWPDIHATATMLTAHTLCPVDVARFSEFLDRYAVRATFESLVAEYAHDFTAALSSPNSALKRAMEHELARRRRFAHETGKPTPVKALQERAARQLANYAAQGTLLRRWGIAAYLPWMSAEVELMTAREPAFWSNVLDFFYDQHPRVPTADDALGAIPDAHKELRTTLALYLRDLPATPGAIVPGLVTDVMAALSKLLTPGLLASGAREITALNRVLPGGSMNRQRVDALLSTSRQSDLSAWRREVTTKKLWCHLASRYDNHALDREYRRHHTVLKGLVACVPSGAGTALALTGSLTKAPDGMWHPYLSDIDVMPLHRHAADNAAVEGIRQAYDSAPKPPWLYLNTGAQVGVAGLVRDPYVSLFAADQITTLSAHEFAYLDRCTECVRFVGGDRDTYGIFVATVAAERHRRARTRPLIPTAGTG